jgi:hypothetical protein
MTLKEKIKHRLDDYLEFNSDELFSNADKVKIFGGAIRDSISELEIHDVDILCGPKSAGIINDVLLQHGYQHLPSLSSKDLNAVYIGIAIISEPHTYMNNNNKIVQIIRPRNATNSDIMDNINNLINEVDISCCGVSYDGINVIETVEDAVLHCLQRIYIVRRGKKMSIESRIAQRTWKLQERGWHELKSHEHRNVTINDILADKDFDSEYIKEHIYKYNWYPIFNELDDELPF